jgi:hypothetical protein
MQQLSLEQRSFFWQGIMDLEAIDDALSIESTFFPYAEKELVYEAKWFIRNQINLIRGKIGSYSM